MKKSLIQFIYYLIYFDKYFMEIHKIYLTNKARFFQPPCTHTDWLENVRWFKTFLIFMQEKYLKMVSIKYVLFYQCSRIIFTFKQDLKMRSVNHRKLSKFGPITPQAALLTKKSLKPEPPPSMVHFSTKVGKLNFIIETMGLGRHKIVLLIWWRFAM